MAGMDAHGGRTSSRALRAVVVVAAVGLIGSVLMAIAHAGVQIPLFSALGPGGGAAIPPAAAGFTVGAILYLVALVGLARRRPWAWALGLVVFALTLTSAAVPFRGVGSIAGILVGGIGLALLLARPVRSSLLSREATS